MNWNQPMCTRCWFVERPGVAPTVVLDDKPQRCALCGVMTAAGIYVRRHPDKVPYPAKEKHEDS